MGTSKIGGITVYVKKYYSTNPDKNKFIKLETALEMYQKYLLNINNYSQKVTAKTFKEWCKTEI